EAILARLNRVDERLDAVDGQHLVSNEDFRSGQQALSNRIDAAQAFAKQASDAVENLAQTTASAGDLLVLKATVETLDGSVRTLQEKQTKAPPLIVPAPKRPIPAKPKPKPKPMEPPPFSILGVEYRGGERFLSVAPPGSTQLSQIYLIRQGDAVAGTTWRLTDLDDRTAHFDVAGA
ncbi:methyl-accepting chemotaxis protein, partial [Pseudomonas aeruginosa]